MVVLVLGLCALPPSTFSVSPLLATSSRPSCSQASNQSQWVEDKGAGGENTSFSLSVSSGLFSSNWHSSWLQLWPDDLPWSHPASGLHYASSPRWTASCYWYTLSYITNPFGFSLHPFSDQQIPYKKKKYLFKTHTWVLSCFPNCTLTGTDNLIHRVRKRERSRWVQPQELNTADMNPSKRL